MAIGRTRTLQGAFQDVHGIPENPTGKELINMVRLEEQVMI
jgi:hypothetical protein